MPIYEYVCRACGKQSEIIQKISDPPEKKCPLCGKRQLQKLVSAAGFRLKGGGWYETDFKSDKKKNVAGDSAPDAAKPETAKTESAASEAKPGKADKADKPDKAAKKDKDSKPSKKAAA